MTRINFAAVGFCVASVLFLIAAIIPSMHGGSLNAGLFATGVMFFVLAIAVNRKAPKPPNSTGA